MQRRRFFSGAMAAAVLAKKGTAIAEATQGAGDGSIPRVSNAGTMRGEMLYRKLGATGVEYLS